MATLIFDIESNGLLDTMTKIHCLVIKDVETGFVEAYTGTRIVDGVRYLMDADLIIGHNVINFDVPAIQKIYPWFSPRKVYDTIVLSRLLYADIKQSDFKREGFPKSLIGRHSLEAWGHRLGNYKGDYKGGWEVLSDEMLDYCVQDVEVTHSLWLKEKAELDDWGWPEAVELEHEVAWIIARQIRYGVKVDLKAAADLYGTLVARRDALEKELQHYFPPIPYEWTPKASNRKFGYVKGQSITRYKIFNPSSRDQCAERLMSLGWKPQEFTESGKPKIDDEILASLPFPEAKPLAEYFMILKRIGQLATGDEAWLKAEKDGRIHGGVITNGAVTGRMTHQKPNLAQVPSVEAPYGAECRAIFVAAPGKSFVGCDADALEMRCLAHFMAKYDGGQFIEILLKGRKEDGTDQHSVNALALGCKRSIAKTWFYAFIFGAGDWKLGFTLGVSGSRKKVAKAGESSRAKFLERFPALAKIVSVVKARAEKQGYLLGLDGRRLFIRSEHAALNTLLQSAGALVMKKALVILDADLRAAGLVTGVNYEFVLNIHDEWQIEVDDQHAELVAKLAPQAITKAGEHFGFRCPLVGNSDIGKNWKETH